jgi:integrase
VAWHGRSGNTTWANSSVNKYTEAICAILNFSASQKRIPFNPVAGFKKLPKNSPEMLFWDEIEAGSFLAWASSKYSGPSNKCPRKARKNYVAYLLALNTGMRAGEIWGLKPHDLFFSEDGDGATIFVRRQLNGASREFAPLKGGVNADQDKSRHVPCSRELRKELEAQIQFNQIRGDKTIFQSTFGNPVDHDSFADRFDRDVANWGGRRIRFHDLRHTAATLMLSQGIDVKTVSEILGHYAESRIMPNGSPLAG